jgi:hypothetical protein
LSRPNLDTRQRAVLGVGFDRLFQIGYRDSGLATFGMRNRQHVQRPIVGGLVGPDAVEVPNRAVGLAGIERERGGIEPFHGVQRLRRRWLQMPLAQGEVKPGPFDQVALFWKLRDDVAQELSRFGVIVLLKRSKGLFVNRDGIDIGRPPFLDLMRRRGFTRRRNDLPSGGLDLRNWALGFTGCRRP